MSDKKGFDVDDVLEVLSPYIPRARKARKPKANPETPPQPKVQSAPCKSPGWFARQEFNSSPAVRKRNRIKQCEVRYYAIINDNLIRQATKKNEEFVVQFYRKERPDKDEDDWIRTTVPLSGLTLFKESDSSDLDTPGPSGMSTQAPIANDRRSTDSGSSSTMSSIVYPTHAQVSKLGYNDTNSSIGSPNRGNSTELMPKPTLGLPKFDDDEAEYISTDDEQDEAPPPDSIFHQTSLNRLRRKSPNRERTIYTPPSTLSVTPDPSADEISGSAIHTTPLTSQRSAALDTSQTWDDMDGFEDLVNESNASKEMDNSAISAVSHQTDITQSELTQNDDDEWEDDGLDDFIDTLCQQQEVTQKTVAKNPTTSSPKLKKTAEKRKRSDTEIESRKRTKSESTAKNDKPSTSKIAPHKPETSKTKPKPPIAKPAAKEAPIVKKPETKKVATKAPKIAPIVTPPADTEEDGFDDDDDFDFDAIVEENDKAEKAKK